MSYLSFDSRGGYLEAAAKWKAYYMDLSVRIRECKAKCKASVGPTSPNQARADVIYAKWDLIVLKREARELLDTRATMKSLAQDVYQGAHHV